MAFFDRFWRRGRADDRESDEGGYYALYESQRPLDPDDRTTSYRPAGSTDFSRWDAGLSQLDSSAALVPEDRGSFWKRAFWLGRRKRWWTVRIVAAIIAVFIALVAWLAITAPLSKSLEPIAAPQVTLLASDGTPIARSGAMVAAPVKVADLPPHVIEPFLAIEDRRFYSHWGVDPRGIARAVWTGRGGGSTITQQLAKFTWLTSERSLTRKAQEALIAFWIETWLTKDEILERYLSNAYFGDNQYGLRAASMHYFYRKPENLKPEQAAMLAGLLQAPSRYNPTKHYDRAKARMDLVVGAMVDAGYLTQAQADRMPSPRLDVRTIDELPTGTYFADWALPLAREGIERGYEKQVVQTTLDAQLQALANRVVSRARLGNAQVGLVAMRPTGEVVAMVGGKSYADSPFNRVTQAKRQPGSTFKLFVYLAALEAGWEPDDTISNQSIETGSYRPKNARERYSETITLEDAFATSSNVAAVRLFNEVGSDAVIRTARSLGVTSDLPEGDPSLALGTTSMSLLELTAAYAGVAANEYPVRPYAFPQEEESWWEWLTNSRGSFSGRVHEDMEQMLRAAINRGTGEAAELPIANFGKTGTTQNYRDALFVGYAGDLVVGVWVGNDDNSPLDNVSGGGLPARIWKDFMRGALDLPAPKPKASPNPQGPVEPLDINIEDGEEIPLGEDGTTLRIEEGGLILSQDGVPLELRVTEDGIQVEPTGDGP
ncbi:transglycosylase domain-containing protein [Erythrobacter sp. SCSIO 43205]|uniref:transglycosylase domain-containing protein n=1 Tax=Erythrobacter sp. SCSIO 43205 TaxID=2779361 RepID=UPI001CA8274F|nr:transglycosylase domain-containing protein [Erythrobacter sp. SCSIO 43205]UAB79490.1 transglycosylase domain-containing protein [Erythrobacter sp. SCSIO 43205]